MVDRDDQQIPVVTDQFTTDTTLEGRLQRLRCAHTCFDECGVIRPVELMFHRPHSCNPRVPPCSTTSSTIVVVGIASAQVNCVATYAPAPFAKRPMRSRSHPDSRP